MSPTVLFFLGLSNEGANLLFLGCLGAFGLAVALGWMLRSEAGALAMASGVVIALIIPFAFGRGGLDTAVLAVIVGFWLLAWFAGFAASWLFRHSRGGRSSADPASDAPRV
jgi:hypothetical protein